MPRLSRFADGTWAYVPSQNSTWEISIGNTYIYIVQYFYGVPEENILSSFVGCHMADMSCSSKVWVRVWVCIPNELCQKPSQVYGNIGVLLYIYIKLYYINIHIYCIYIYPIEKGTLQSIVGIAIINKQ